MLAPAAFRTPIVVTIGGGRWLGKLTSDGRIFATALLRSRESVHRAVREGADADPVTGSLASAQLSPTCLQ